MNWVGYAGMVSAITSNGSFSSPMKPHEKLHSLVVSRLGAEETQFPDFAVEKALAHAIQNRAEAAYRRGNLLKKRRELMEAWAMFCSRAVNSASAPPAQQASEQGREQAWRQELYRRERK